MKTSHCNDPQVAEWLVDHFGSVSATSVLVVTSECAIGLSEQIVTALGDVCLPYVLIRDQGGTLSEAEIQEWLSYALKMGVDWVVACGRPSVMRLARRIAQQIDAPNGDPVKWISAPSLTKQYFADGATHHALSGPSPAASAIRAQPQATIYRSEQVAALEASAATVFLIGLLAQSLNALVDTHPGGIIEIQLSRYAEASVKAMQCVQDSTPAKPYSAELTTILDPVIYVANAAPETLHMCVVAALCSWGVGYEIAHQVAWPYTAHRMLNSGQAAGLWGQWLAPMGTDACAHLYDCARSANVAHDLRGLGFKWSAVPSLTDTLNLMTVDLAYPPSGITALVDDIYHSRRPSVLTTRRDWNPEGLHAGRDLTEMGTRLEQAKVVVIALHGRGASADRFVRDLQPYLLELDGVCTLAVQATDAHWYPNHTAQPLASNQPWLDDACKAIDEVWALARRFIPASHIVLVGFSQGACLLLTWVQLRDHSVGGLFAFSGFSAPVPTQLQALQHSTVYLSRSQNDPHATGPLAQPTFDAMRQAISHTVIHIEPGDSHRIHEHDGQTLAATLRSMCARC